MKAKKNPMSFQELAKLSTEELSKQPPVTYEEALKQTQEVLKSIGKNKKQTKPMTFQERAKLAAELLVKQPPTTLKIVKEQIKGDVNEELKKPKNTK